MLNLALNLARRYRDILMIHSFCDEIMMRKSSLQPGFDVTCPCCADSFTSKCRTYKDRFYHPRSLVLRPIPVERRSESRATPDKGTSTVKGVSQTIARSIRYKNDIQKLGIFLTSLHVGLDLHIPINKARLFRITTRRHGRIPQ
jgi:hypothetical protein